MKINEFIQVIKESGFNIFEMYSKAANETLILLALIVLLFLISYFFINRKIKISNSLKMIESMSGSKSYEDIDKKLTILVDDLPKRDETVSNLLNSSKEHILFRTAKLIQNMTIERKIDIYKELSSKYLKLSLNSKKYNNTELTSFYEQKSKELLDINLTEEVKHYIQNCSFSSNEIQNVNAVIEYANSLKNPNDIIDDMINELNRLSYGYNLELFKFIEKLNEKDSKQILKYASEKQKEIFESGEYEISINILDYLLENNKKEKVYNYISSLKLDYYLQQLHNQYFNKKDDLNLDLAFISNPTKIESDYKKYLDESITSNWRDSSHIEYVSKSQGVIDVLGHTEFRSLIERVDNIKSETENKKMIEEALAIAKRAETIAIEAKSLNKRPIIIKAPKKEDNN